MDLECPIDKGDVKITKTVDLTDKIPPGKYTVTADAYTADDESITCLVAVVSF